ncbi:hypothetical protein B0A50_00166 [Salinomyces thailandicus]|uniref:Transcription initiation factor IIE subunit beta n=1 Tax=Salinomyces thailandicus TaxID=706561 RepID=A0A4U0UHH4_9PEZI|nr:hypothetical protein B0A50_00166 [Salinomyces thailandica]
MSSGGLRGSLRHWQTERHDAVRRNVDTSARTSTPKPISTSTPAATADKRSHDTAVETTAPATAGGQVSMGQELMTRVFEAIKYLRDRAPNVIPFENITSYLSLPTHERGGKTESAIRRALQGSDRAQYLPKSESGLGKEAFKYRPLVPVTNADQLREYLVRMSLDSARGLLVKDLKDGWPDCGPAINRLEQEGWVLVVRNKKDETPKLLYADSPSLHPPNSQNNLTVGHIDQDFKDFWAKIRLPANENDIRAELERAGITPTSQVKEAKPLGGGKKEKKQRKEKKNAKKTNVHMAGILKDYSHKRPGGK